MGTHNKVKFVPGSKIENLYNCFDNEGKRIKFELGYEFDKPNESKGKLFNFNQEYIKPKLIMSEITWEEFVEKYKPVSNKTRPKSFSDYMISFKELKSRSVYDMFVWSVTDITIPIIKSGRKIAEAHGYIICTEAHYIDELITIKPKIKDEDRSL